MTTPTLEEQIAALTRGPDVFVQPRQAMPKAYQFIHGDTAISAPVAPPINVSQVIRALQAKCAALELERDWLLERDKTHDGLRLLYEAAIDQRNAYSDAYIVASRECDILLRRNTEIRQAADGMRAELMAFIDTYSSDYTKSKAIAAYDAAVKD